jgi:hypothetical protein
MKKVVIISGAAVLGLATLLGGWFMVKPGAPAYAAGALYRQADFGDHHGRHGGHKGFRGKRAFAMICSDRRNHRIEAATGFVEGFVNFTPEQEKPWKDLTQAIEEGSAKIGQTCEELDPKGADVSAPEKLARIETVLATGLSVVQDIRPAFTTFYDSLTDKQQQALEGLMSHRRGGRHR